MHHMLKNASEKETVLYNSEWHQYGSFGSASLAGWPMHIGGTQMVLALNMDERSDTTSQADSAEEGNEWERKK